MPATIPVFRPVHKFYDIIYSLECSEQKGKLKTLKKFVEPFTVEGVTHPVSNVWDFSVGNKIMRLRWTKVQMVEGRAEMRLDFYRVEDGKLLDVNSEFLASLKHD